MISIPSIMQYEDLDDPQKLISELTKLKEFGYVFRGISDSNYKLIPNAFRDDSLSAMIHDYPIEPHMITKHWFDSPDMLRIVQNWANALVMHPALKHQIKKLCHYIIYFMRYNYWLHTCWEKNKTLSLLEEQKASLLKLRPNAYWAEKGTFIYFFNAFFPSLLTFTTEDGRTHHQPICEDTTGLDETRPQHYGLRDGKLGTSILDWSLNPLHALYFAIDYDADTKEKEEFPSTHFCICALKIIDANASPICLEECGTENVRAKAQEGVFTRFKEPCSFYMINGRFPTIEDFLGYSGFSLIKFRVKKSNHNISFFQELLKNKDVNKMTLFPEKNS